MQIAVWVSALFFTQNTYTTMGGAVRQADYSQPMAVGTPRLRTV
jgi:hypothetical protein